MNEILMYTGSFLFICSIFSLIISIIVAIFSKKNRKMALKIIIISIILGIIGFGTCTANISLGNMH